MRTSQIEDITYMLKNSPKDSCWTWKRGWNISVDGELLPASHVVIMLLGRKVPRDHIVHHRCENRRCINPTHLRVITPSQHMKVLSHQKKRVETTRKSKMLWRGYEERLQAIVPQRLHNGSK